MAQRFTLFVAGINPSTDSRDLAHEFERFGPLIRCDIPRPRSGAPKSIAFIEYRDPLDAEDAFNEMHGQIIDGYRISIQWSRRPPSSAWRFDTIPGEGRHPPPRRSVSPTRGNTRRYRDRSRSRSRSLSRSPSRRRYGSPSAGRSMSRDRYREYPPYYERRGPSPVRYRSRSRGYRPRRSPSPRGRFRSPNSRNHSYSPRQRPPSRSISRERRRYTPSPRQYASPPQRDPE